MRWGSRTPALLVPLTLLVGAACAQPGKPVPVQPQLETAPVPSSGDAADDAAIWVHPEDAALSVILGTDKSAGLAVYDLSGAQLQFLPVGDLNNVDVRYGFALGAGSVDLIVGGNRSDVSLDVFTINAKTRQVASISAGALPITTSDAYGIALYRSWISGKTYAFVSDQDGLVEQYELVDAGQGLVGATLVRSLQVGSTAEGMVADDRYGLLYVAEENVGIWRYHAEPNAGTERFMVDGTGKGQQLKADVEGLAIYQTADGGGYLMASSQGSHDFAIYERSDGNRILMKFAIVASATVDGCQETDGIEVTSVSLGPAFPDGLFIAQDGENPGANQNFKIVPWPAIASASNGLLVVASGWDPRAGPPPGPGDPGYPGAGR